MICHWNPNLLHVHDGDVVIYVFKLKYNTGWEGWGGVGGRGGQVSREVTFRPRMEKWKEWIASHIVFSVRHVHVCLVVVVVVVHENSLWISYCHTLLQLAFGIYIIYAYQSPFCSVGGRGGAWDLLVYYPQHFLICMFDCFEQPSDTSPHAPPQHLLVSRILAHLDGEGVEGRRQGVKVVDNRGWVK